LNQLYYKTEKKECQITFKALYKRFKVVSRNQQMLIIFMQNQSKAYKTLLKRVDLRRINLFLRKKCGNQ
jgi:hypothetical protein